MTGGWLNAVERAGNRLPDPSTLFALGTLAVMLLSDLAVRLGWTVTRTLERDGALETETVAPVSLLDADGLWWLLSSLVKNFVEFPPLGLVLVGLLGIGVAERSGLLPVLLRRLLAAAPTRLLVPMTVFVGVLSSLALDAGYVVLPPLAGALFLAAGRSPLAGIAAVTAGVTCGFSANLFLTGLDPLLAGLSTAAAHLLDPSYEVAISANWWFMIVSTLVLTAAGAFVTWRFVEPRLPRPTAAEMEHGARPAEAPEQLHDADRGLRFAGWTCVALLVLLRALPALDGGAGAAAAHRLFRHRPRLRHRRRQHPARPRRGGHDVHRARVLCGAVHRLLRALAARRDAGRGGRRVACGAGAAARGADACLHRRGDGGQPPHRLGERQVRAVRAGVRADVHAGRHQPGADAGGLPRWIILAFIRRFRPDAGLGTLVALMLPYTLVFAPVWALLLGLWVLLGWPLGPGGGLVYPPSG